MKKYLFISILSCILLVTSCKKNTNNAGSWTFEGVTYSATTASLTDTALIAINGSSTNLSSTLAFFFASPPVRSGTYRVVNYTSPLDSNQIYIQFINSTSFYYFSTGNDSVNANVTVSSAGKVSISVPPVYLKSYSAAISDSAQLKATIYQQ